MKFALVLLALIATGCSGMKAYKNPSLGVGPQTMAVTAAGGNLSTINTDGVSTTDFAIPLNNNDKDKKLFIDFQTNTQKYSNVTISAPAVEADGCTAKPKISQWLGKDGKPQTEVYWAKGKTHVLTGQSYTHYDEVTSVEANSDGVLTVVLWVDKACTNVHGTLKVQFK